MITVNTVYKHAVAFVVNEIMGMGYDYEEGTLETLGYKTFQNQVEFTNVIGKPDFVLVSGCVIFKKGNDIHSLKEIDVKFEAECLRYTSLFLESNYVEKGTLDFIKIDKKLLLPIPICKVKKVGKSMMFFPAADKETPGEVLYLVIEIN